MATATLLITRGDDKDIGLQFASDMDLTGCTVCLTVKPAPVVNEEDPTDATAVLKAQESTHNHPNADPTHGKTVITLPKEDTGGAPVGDYVDDVQIKNLAGKIRTYKQINGDLPVCRVTPESTQRYD